MSASFRKSLRKLRSISPADRFLLAEATLRLGLARLALLLLPFRLVSRRLGTPMRETGEDIEDGAMLRRIAWAVGAVARRAPWRCQCLEQGIAAKMMLRRRRLTNTLYLGVARGEEKKVAAHAWLRSGTVYVTGGANRKQFSVVYMFADEAPK